MTAETSNTAAGEQARKLDLISQMTGMSEDELLDALEAYAQSQSAAGEAEAPADGCFAVIAFMGHNEHTGYVTEILKNGQPAYHVDLPEKLWGGNPLAYVEYAASAWFSERPVSEESVRKAWDAQCRRAAERARQEAEWQRMQDQRVLTAAGENEDNDNDDPDDSDLYGPAL